jgi:hypothetical protein
MIGDIQNIQCKHSTPDIKTVTVDSTLAYQCLLCYIETLETDLAIAKLRIAKLEVTAAEIGLKDSLDSAYKLC